MYCSSTEYEARKLPSGESVGESVGESGFSVEKTSNGTNIRRQKVLSLVRDNPSVSASEIGLILNVSARTIERDFDWLKDRGYLMREGADFGGKWIILKEFEPK